MKIAISGALEGRMLHIAPASEALLADVRAGRGIYDAVADHNDSAHPDELGVLPHVDVLWSGWLKDPAEMGITCAVDGQAVAFGPDNLLIRCFGDGPAEREQPEHRQVFDEIPELADLAERFAAAIQKINAATSGDGGLVLHVENWRGNTFSVDVANAPAGTPTSEIKLAVVWVAPLFDNCGKVQVLDADHVRQHGVQAGDVIDTGLGSVFFLLGAVVDGRLHSASIADGKGLSPSVSVLSYDKDEGKLLLVPS